MEMVLVLFYAEEPLKGILDVGDKVHDESPNDAVGRSSVQGSLDCSCSSGSG